MRDIARAASVSVSTASQWRKSPDFQTLVSTYEKGWRNRVGEYVDVVQRGDPDITEGRAFRWAMLVNSLFREKLEIEDGTGRKVKDEPGLLATVVTALRIKFEQPPVSLAFLPSEKFLEMSPEDVQRQHEVVMKAITRMIGEPKDTVTD